MKGNDAPKYRLEHSVSDKAGCQQTTCKKAGIKIAKGELRLGSNTWYEQDHKFYMVWRHWGCATPGQIKGLKSIAGQKPENVPGFSKISAESQEQVRLAFEEENVVDKEFKDIREDLAKRSFHNDGEIKNAVGYKVELDGRGVAGCRNATCKENAVKIEKGGLRLGIATMWNDQEMWVYKHCDFDLNEAKERLDQGALEGLDSLPIEYKTVVLHSFERGEALEPPEPQAPLPKVTKPRKPRASKENNVDDEAAQEPFTEAPKGRKKRASGNITAADEGGETAPKKRGRPSTKIVSDQGESTAVDTAQAPNTESKREEAVDPTVAKIQAIADEMRLKASGISSKRS